MLPLSLPIIATVGLYYLSDRWNEWYNPMIFINSSRKTVLQLVPDDDLKCTVWFDKSDMTPLRAELITDGRVTVVLELHDWAETPSAGA